MRRLILAMLLLTGPAWATADGPDAWRVYRVAPGDMLNLRTGPGTAHPVIGTLAHDARGLQAEICVPTLTFAQYDAMDDATRAQLATLPRWCLLSREGARLGWASGAYLTEDAGD
ncbi:SH3 domain-containing protein [Actibacterium sp. XHP0104]|uniref:SH3 domain-containing protein n=1 Tax=Actibacterium sp. XHP0104 TaxID=2984335 RepID=UPI0021E91A7B|nr:hypothetical protein [Actibacterium sp. XHP0104]MCV2882442.1 hypothetical protein [Actibacterium sp. XHP0104]